MQAHGTAKKRKMELEIRKLKIIKLVKAETNLKERPNIKKGEITSPIHGSNRAYQ